MFLYVVCMFGLWPVCFSHGEFANRLSRNVLIQSIQLLASQMDSVDLSVLDETALKSIRLLQVYHFCRTTFL